MKQYIVEQEETVSSFLEKKGYPHQLLKKILANKQVWVNQKAVTNYHTLLHACNEIIIFAQNYQGILILYEDHDLLVALKHPNMLCVSDGKEKEKTLYHYLSQYVKKKQKTNKIFIVHRLDYETSGIVIFAKSEKIKEKLQKDWSHVKRKYVAVVHGKVEGKGTLRYYLKERGANLVSVHQKQNQAKEAITHYETVVSGENYSLLSLTIETGRKHQIRISLKEFGHTIVGDCKYGNDSFKQLHLYANEIIFKHPVTQKEIHIFLPIPNRFKKLV